MTSTMAGDRALNDRMTAMEIAFATMTATLGTKLDALTTAVSSQHGDHEARLRAVEVRPVVDLTHEVRLQRLEADGDATVPVRLAKLERAYWLLIGGAVVLGGSAGGIASVWLG
jgi:hypothetical protein